MFTRPLVSRRDCFKAALAASCVGLPRWFIDETLANAAQDETKSPNDRPGVLLVGCGGMGTGDAKNAARYGNIVAVCDVDKSHREKVGDELKAEGRYSDFRKAMEHKGVDVVINGTPDHWHTLVNIHALRSGKDVYCEKPLTLTIDEGQKLVEVARRDAAAFCKPAASSGATRASAWPASWSATAASASSPASRPSSPAACTAARSKPRPCPPSSIGTSGRARRLRSITSRSAATSRSATGTTTPAAR